MGPAVRSHSFTISASFAQKFNGEVRIERLISCWALRCPGYRGGKQGTSSILAWDDGFENFTIQNRRETTCQGLQPKTALDLLQGLGPKDAQPIVFHHGWPLSSDDWDNQMLFFLANGYRVVAHDRRGHGRSSQIDTGHDMDHYASDASAVVEHLDLQECGPYRPFDGRWRGGALCREIRPASGPRGQGRAARLRSSAHAQDRETNPDGTPSRCSMDSAKRWLRTGRSSSSMFASGPFYGFNRPGAKALQGVIENWWRQGMMGSAFAHYEGIKAFSERPNGRSESDHVPTLVMQGDDDQVVPYKDASLLQAKLLSHGTLKIYPGFPHGLMTIHADVINADLLLSSGARPLRGRIKACYCRKVQSRLFMACA